MRRREIIEESSGGTMPIRLPEPHKLKRLIDPKDFRNFEDSKQDHHSQKPWFAWLAGARGVPARRP